MGNFVADHAASAILAGVSAMVAASRLLAVSDVIPDGAWYGGGGVLLALVVVLFRSQQVQIRSLQSQNAKQQRRIEHLEVELDKVRRGTI